MATLNVKTFGATGNGVTDDKAAIQATLNATAIGDSVYFPTGTYLVNTTVGASFSHNALLLLPNRSITIMGDGIGASTVTTTKDNLALFHGYPGGVAQSSQDLTFTDLSMVCTSGYNSTGFTSAILTSGHSLTCSRVLFMDWVSDIRYPDDGGLSSSQPVSLTCNQCQFMSSIGIAGIAYQAAGPGFGFPTCGVLGSAITDVFIGCVFNGLIDSTFAGADAGSVKKPRDGMVKTLGSGACTSLTVTNCFIANDGEEGIATSKPTGTILDVQITGCQFNAPEGDPLFKGGGCCAVALDTCSGNVKNNTMVDYPLRNGQPFHYYLNSVSVGNPTGTVVTTPNSLATGVFAKQLL